MRAALHETLTMVNRGVPPTSHELNYVLTTVRPTTSAPSLLVPESRHAILLELRQGPCFRTVLG